MYRSAGKRVFGLLEIPEFIKLRLENGDRLKVNFEPQVNLETASWSAIVIEPLPFASLGEISILLMRPFDRETQTHSDLVLNSVSFSVTSNDELVAALSRQRPTPVLATVEYSEKQLKGQIHGLRHIAMDNGKICGCQSETPDQEIVDWFHAKYSTWRAFLSGEVTVETNAPDIFALCTPASKQHLQIGTSQLNPS